MLFSLVVLVGDSFSPLVVNLYYDKEAMSKFKNSKKE
jgi:hypothetical protein